MFVQITKSGSGNKKYVSYLVRESFRTPQGPRSRTVCNISRLPPEVRDLVGQALRGQMLVLQNQGPWAQELLEKACKLDPNNAETHYQLGTLYDSNRRNREAVAEFEKVTQLRPNDARAYDYLALNLEPLGEISVKGRDAPVDRH